MNYNPQYRAIETEYAGCRFRSRLEARWAVFFDQLKIEWEHEPDGFATPAGRYLPDFKIQIPGNQQNENGRFQWFEVKPPEWCEDARHAALATLSDVPLIIARGMPRGYLDQLQASKANHRLRSPLMVYGLEERPWPVAFCDASSADWDDAFYCSLGANRHWCQEETHRILRDRGIHLALYGLHDAYNVGDYSNPGFMTYPPLTASHVDRAYAAARSERFGT